MVGSATEMLIPSRATMKLRPARERNAEANVITISGSYGIQERVAKLKEGYDDGDGEY